jgi:hypothetical protein
MGPSTLVGFQLEQQGRIANLLSQVQVLFDGSTGAAFGSSRANDSEFHSSLFRKGENFVSDLFSCLAG